MIRHVVVYRDGGALLDRQTLALLTGRSEETIRRRCAVAEYRDGKAMYDLDTAEATLQSVLKRRPKGSVGKVSKRTPWDQVGYAAVHARLRRGKGKASAFQCIQCGDQAKDWAYDHTDPDERFDADGPYSLDPDRYHPMCRPCHLALDR